jgi:hypothetical protein
MRDASIGTDRRVFMRRGAMGVGALWMCSLQELSARAAFPGQVVVGGMSPYGPISPKRDGMTGLELLMLPDGFRYWSYSWNGDVMSDGVACPDLHDGMAVVGPWPTDPGGRTFTFAMNTVNLAQDYNKAVLKGDYRQSEWAGACYSPDGQWLFVNIQTPGITFAISGPWGAGPL